MPFGPVLRLLRVDAGISLRTLAREVGVSSAYLSRVEHSHDPVPTADRLIGIARALGLPPTVLVDLAGRSGTSVARYVDRTPAAGSLFQEIARRDLSPAQLLRVRHFVEREFPLASATAACPAVSTLLAPERVLVGMMCGEIADAVEIAAQRLGGRGAPALAREILRREAESSSAVGRGLALPHAFGAGSELGGALVVLARPLDAPTPDGEPLRVVLVLAGPDRTRGLAALACAARLADRRAVSALCAASTPEAALAALLAWEAEHG